MKILFLALGCLSLATGVVGIVLPILPTTPFVLLSAFCFARGSPKFHIWITEHRFFGRLIRNYRAVGVPPDIKIWAVVCITVSIGVSWYVLETQAVRTVLVCGWLVAVIIISQLPYRPPVTSHQRVE